MAATLTLLGFLVYVFIPASLIRNDMAVFFLIMNLILISIAIGMTFIATVILPSMQSLVLRLIMCLNPWDRCIEGITKKRLESMQSRNVKISLMITGAISFLMFEAGAYLSTNEVFKNVYLQVVGADIFVQGFLGNVFLHEELIADYLDE